mmetsp:Transcript_2530/g.6015  ORF Transcript_2530/g.6015 Transcript_2530/m.6015 type:complete len:410 (+) Transcript_2530:109-1338(+)
MHVQVARNLCFVPTLSLKSAFRGPLSRLRRATYELRFCLNSCPNYGVSCFTRLNFATQPKLRDHSVAAGPTLVFNGDIGTWSLLAACASLAQIAEQRTPLGKNLSASVLALLAALCLACLGLLPSQAPAYEVVTSVFLPLASVLFVLEIQFGRLGGPEVVTLASFSVGVVGTILGTIVAWLLLGPKLGQEGWKLAGALCATYIGGSVNFAATAQVLGMRSGVAPAMAADNIAMAAYLAALSAVPVKPSGWGNGSTAEPKREGPPRLTSSWRRLSLCVGFGMAMLAAGTALAEVLGLPTLGIALSTLLASLASGSINARAGSSRSPPHAPRTTRGNPPLPPTAPIIRQAPVAPPMQGKPHSRARSRSGASCCSSSSPPLGRRPAPSSPSPGAGGSSPSWPCSSSCTWASS